MLEDTTSSAIRDAPAHVVPRHRTLDGFVEAVSRADGVGLTDVDAFTTLVVRTDNSVYQITILQPYAREVVVQGGAFFPERHRGDLWHRGVRGHATLHRQRLGIERRGPSRLRRSQSSTLQVGPRSDPSALTVVGKELRSRPPRAP